MQNAYQVFDLGEHSVVRSGFSNREEAKATRNALNEEVYGKEFYHSLLGDNRMPRYIVSRGDEHPEGPSFGPVPRNRVRPVEPPKKEAKKTEEEKDKILNTTSGKPKSKAQKRKQKNESSSS